jgi:riboflavin biosynthesis pyrimidine reductase
VHQIYPVLSPEGGGVGSRAGGGARDAAELLAGLYAYPDGQDRPWVRANMIASVDGTATIGGRSGALGGPADRMLLQVLRALADVILVGAGTARAEGYGPARAVPALAALRQDRPATAPIAVVSARLDLDPRAPLLAEAPAEARTIVMTTQSAPRSQQAAIARHAELIVADSDQLTAGQVIAALAGRGHARILAEGGPSLLAQIAEAGRLDELCLTVSPVLAGGQGRRILSGAPIGDQQPGTPEPLRLAHVLADDDYLFCRYVRTV